MNKIKQKILSVLVSVLLSNLIFFYDVHAETIPENEADFVFHASKLSNGHFIYKAKGWGTIIYGIWAGQPYAFVIHVDSGGGYTWQNHDGLDESIKWYNGPEDKIVAKNWGSKEHLATDLGDIDYATFDGFWNSVQIETKCIAFSSFYDGMMASRLMGFYCDRDKFSKTETAAILTSLGVKKPGHMPTTKDKFVTPNTRSNKENLSDQKQNDPVPSAASSTNKDIESRLFRLKKLEDDGLITKEEAARKRQELLDKL